MVVARQGHVPIDLSEGLLQPRPGLAVEAAEMEVDEAFARQAAMGIRGRLADHAGMDRFSCPPDDPYGTDVTSVKFGIFINLEKASVGVLMMVRNFVIGRMLFMVLPIPPPDFLLAMAPILDMISAKRLDLSIGAGPFPVEMYSGTIIKPGLLVDIEELVFFGLFELYKCYIHIQWEPTLLLEAHIFISPIRFGSILQVTGLEGDPKYIAVQKQAAAKKQRALNELEARLAADAALQAKKQARIEAEKAKKAAAANAAAAPKPVYDTPCKAESCYTVRIDVCARVVRVAYDCMRLCECLLFTCARACFLVAHFPVRRAWTCVTCVRL